MEYLLLDLERTISGKIPCYWKYNKHGYTYIVEHAGLFTKETAENIVASDFDKTTVMIHYKTIEKILAISLKAHEGV